MGTLGSARRLWPTVRAQLPPRPPRRGRPRASDALVFRMLALFCRAGCSWEVFDLLLEGSAVSGRTVRRRLAEWRRAGVFETVCEALVARVPGGEVGYLDASFIRSRGGGSEEVGLTRHGKGSKIQVIVNGDSRPIAWVLTSANPSEQRTFRRMLAQVNVVLPERIVADRAYDYDDLRDETEARGSTLVVLHRRDRKRPPRGQDLVAIHYRNRWRVERFFAHLAGWRRVATRWERSYEHYRMWVCLAISLVLAEEFCP